ncbi:MAG: hypothetical protein WBP03_01580 [Candidatus Saccharimonadales bacterium]
MNVATAAQARIEVPGGDATIRDSVYLPQFLRGAAYTLEWSRAVRRADGLALPKLTRTDRAAEWFARFCVVALPWAGNEKAAADLAAQKVSDTQFWGRMRQEQQDAAVRLPVFWSVVQREFAMRKGSPHRQNFRSNSTHIGRLGAAWTASLIPLMIADQEM